MIHSKQAVKAAQTVNRNAWLAQASKELSDVIMNAADKGMRQVTVPLTKYVIGAETLDECAEMLSLLSLDLEHKGYTHRIMLDGTLQIKW